MFSKFKNYFLNDILSEEKDTLRIANITIIFYITLFAIGLLLFLQIVYIFAGNLFQIVVGFFSISIFAYVLYLLKIKKGILGISILMVLFSTTIYTLNLFLYPEMNLINGLLMSSNIIFAFNLLDQRKGIVVCVVHLIVTIVYMLLYSYGLSTAFIQPINQSIVVQIINFIIIYIIEILLIMHYQNAHKNAAKKLVASIQELQKSEQIRKKAQSLSRIGNWDYNFLTDKLVWDEETYKIMGVPLSRENVKGLYIELTHPEDRDFVKKSFDDMLLGKKYHIDYRIIQPSGVQKYITAIGDAEFDSNNKPIRVYGMVQDIDDRKKGEAALKDLLDITSYQNSQLKNFTYIVSHNIRSHSSNFTALIKLLENAATKEEAESLVLMLKTTASKLDETLTNLNEIISITENVSKPKVIKNIKEEILRTLDTLSGLILNASIEIDIQVPIDATIKVIPSYLDSILLNIISNAIKYRSNKRKPKITFTLNKNENYTVLSITDNGLGIDLKRYGDKVFGMYKTFHTNEDARGIGLFITKSHIESMKGKIEVESEVDKGTTFKLYFNEKN